MHNNATKGFTLIELIAVFVIMSILTVTTLRSFSSRSSELVTEAETLRSYIRYAQARALTYGSTYILQCSSGGYTLYRGSINENNKVAFPNGDNKVRLSKEVSITHPSSTFALTFDNWGGPGIVNESTYTPLSDRYAITLRQGDNIQTITVIPTTGFVE